MLFCSVLVCNFHSLFLLKWLIFVDLFEMFAVLGFPAFCHLIVRNVRILLKPNIKSLISSSIEWAR